jgi:hypothetical protein
MVVSDGIGSPGPSYTLLPTVGNQGAALLNPLCADSHSSPQSPHYGDGNSVPIGTELAMEIIETKGLTPSSAATL